MPIPYAAALLLCSLRGLLLLTPTKGTATSPLLQMPDTEGIVIWLNGSVSWYCQRSQHGIFPLHHYHVTDIFVPIAYKYFYFYWEGGKNMYIYIHTCIYMCVYIYVYVYIHTHIYYLPCYYRPVDLGLKIWTHGNILSDSLPSSKPNFWISAFTFLRINYFHETLHFTLNKLLLSFPHPKQDWHSAGRCLYGRPICLPLTPILIDQW